MAAMATVVQDPRDIITPDAFRVADHLIGIPLARPWRRLWAILVDLLLVAILVGLLDAIGLLIAVAGAFLVFRLSRGATGRWYQRYFRRGLGCFGAILVFTGTLVIWENLTDDDPGDDDAPAMASDTAAGSAEEVGLWTGAMTVRDAVALRSATTDEERARLASRIVDRLAEEGIAPAAMRGGLQDLAEGDPLPPPAVASLEVAVERYAARLESRPPRSLEELRAAAADGAAADTIARAPADTLASAAGVGAADTVPQVDSPLQAARDSIARLRAELGQIRADLASESRQRQEAQAQLETGAIRRLMSELADELGLGLGWLGLYFTAFTVLGHGRTPGKRLFHLRVIRLDGQPIGWWTSLQRFGGYSASVLTGMSGFAEIFWDDNRQALQDKLVHTVVIQEPKPPKRVPAVESPAAESPAAEAPAAEPVRAEPPVGDLVGGDPAAPPPAPDVDDPAPPTNPTRRAPDDGGADGTSPDEPHHG